MLIFWLVVLPAFFLFVALVYAFAGFPATFSAAAISGITAFSLSPWSAESSLVGLILTVAPIPLGIGAGIATAELFRMPLERYDGALFPTVFFAMLSGWIARLIQPFLS